MGIPTVTPTATAVTGRMVGAAGRSGDIKMSVAEDGIQALVLFFLSVEIETRRYVERKQACRI